MRGSLLYITNSRMPTEKAHGVQIANMCEAIIESGISLRLVIPVRKNPITSGITKYYGLRLEIPLMKLPTIDFLSAVGGGFGSAAFFIEAVSFYLGILGLSFWKRDETIFTRDHYSPLFIFNKSRVIWEVHELPQRAFGKWLYCRMAKACKTVVCVNRAVEKFFLDKDINKSKLIFAPNAVDENAFKVKETVGQARAILNLPLGRKIVGYTGGMYARKGVNTLVEAAKLFKNTTLMVLIGGPRGELERIRELIRNNDLEGRVLALESLPYRLMPMALRAFDVLVLPNSAKDILSAEQSAPLKMPEYLASGKPIVAAKTPSVTENYGNAGLIFFKPDSARDLVRGIKVALSGKRSLRGRRNKFYLAERVAKIFTNVYN